MNHYFVKVICVSREHFKPNGVCKFYIPMKQATPYGGVCGMPRRLLDVEHMTTVWGFETEEEAWKAIKTHRIEQDDWESWEGGES